MLRASGANTGTETLLGGVWYSALSSCLIAVRLVSTKINPPLSSFIHRTATRLPAGEAPSQSTHPLARCNSQEATGSRPGQFANRSSYPTSDSGTARNWRGCFADPL